MNSFRTYLFLILGIVSSYLIYTKTSLLTTFLLIFSPLTLFFLLRFRYELNFLPFYFLVFLSGRKYKNVESLAEIQKMMKLTDKGIGLEDLIALPAWSPILSLESVSGDIWKELREKFINFTNLLQDISILNEITSLESNYLIENKILIDGKQMSISALKCFMKYVFADIKDDKLDLNFINNAVEEMEKKHKLNFYETLYLSSLEYRKEIAVKGKGDITLKYKAVELIVEIAYMSKFKDLYDWKDPKCYSIIMQPFIISPMINMSDIAVQIKDNLKEYEKICKMNKNDINSAILNFIDYCIFINHPFPLLERYDKELNIHYFLDMSKMNEILDNSRTNDDRIDYSVMNFGMGVRSCLGRHLAKAFFSSFFTSELINSNNFNPKINHLYSGRDNDNSDLFQSIYTLKIFFICIFTVIKNTFI